LSVWCRLRHENALCILLCVVWIINKQKFIKMTEIKNKFCEIQNLKKGDWFMLNNGEEIRNKYKFLGEVIPKVYGGVCFDYDRDFDFGTKVEKIDGYSLYLLQGGRGWD